MDRPTLIAAAIAGSALLLAAGSVLGTPPSAAPAPVPLGDLLPVVRHAPAPPPPAAAPRDTTHATWRELTGGARVTELRPGVGSPLRDGDRVGLDWAVWSADGTLIEDAVAMGAPLRATVGAGTLPPTVEAAILGMAPGARRQVRLPALAVWGGTTPGHVPADSQVVLELELLDVGG